MYANLNVQLLEMAWHAQFILLDFTQVSASKSSQSTIAITGENSNLGQNS